MRYFVTFLIGIGLILLVIILLVRAIFGGGDSTHSTQQVNLVDYANTNVVMRLTVWSGVEADQTHQQLRIDVSQYSSDIYLYNGYENTLVKNETFVSNSKAYADFLRGLQLLGYTQSNQNKDVTSDWRGECPSGERYIYEIVDGSKKVQQLWSSSCGQKRVPGTFLGESKAVNNLFEAQIPTYGDFVDDTQF